MQPMMNIEKVERRLHLALNRINDEIPFVLHKVTSTFSPNASFSNIHFDLVVHTDGTRKIGFTFNQLF